MKKILVPLAVTLLLALAVPAAFAEWELGLSGTEPVGLPADQLPSGFVPGFHVGYAWSVLYFSWDALAMPPYYVQNATSTIDATTGVVTSGPSVPGFLNMYDVGLRFVLRPIEIYTEVGMNNLWVYQEGMANGSFGANLRLGVGLKFGWWGVNLSGTEIFASFSDLGAVVSGLFDANTRTWAANEIVTGLVPSLNLTFYF